MDEPMAVSTKSESDWEKERKAREERKKNYIDALTKKLPNNKVVAELDVEAKQEKRQEESQKRGDWDLVHDAVWGARDIYMEGEASFDEAISQLIEALGVCKTIVAQYPQGDKNRKTKPVPEMAKKLGY